jgi:hypothetical protein
MQKDCYEHGKCPEAPMNTTKSCNLCTLCNHSSAMQGSGEHLHEALNGALQLLQCLSARGAAHWLRRPARADLARLALSVQSAASSCVPLSGVPEDPSAEAEALAALTDTEHEVRRQDSSSRQNAYGGGSPSLPRTGDVAFTSNFSAPSCDGVRRRGPQVACLAQHR